MPIYTPPRVWKWSPASEDEWSDVNRPIAGPTHENDLPVGQHSLQLYSQGTPNGVKVTILLEELLTLGHDAEYDAYLIEIAKGEQFGSGFVTVNPNSKIPALVDRSRSPSTRVFESGAILLYLAEKFDAFLPRAASERAECLSWLFWQMGSTPYLGGGFAHFFYYAHEKLKYPIDRFTLEVKRQLDVLDRNLSARPFLCGNDYNIADIATFPWYGSLVLRDEGDPVADFLDARSYTHVIRWASEIQERPAVRRGQRVNKITGTEDEQVRERHAASDFD